MGSIPLFSCSVLVLAGVEVGDGAAVVLAAGVGFLDGEPVGVGVEVAAGVAGTQLETVTPSAGAIPLTQPPNSVV